MAMFEEENVRSKTLAEANDLINGDRQAEYGPPRQNFDRVAAMWSAYLNYEVDGHDVAVCMALLKIARITSGAPKHDTYVDASAYMALANELKD
jgi:hypothetical protein